MTVYKKRKHGKRYVNMGEQFLQKVTCQYLLNIMTSKD